MKLLLKITIFISIALLFTTCKKKVNAPNDDAEGKGVLYIEVAEKKYFFQQNYKRFTTKTQRADFNNGFFTGNPSLILYEGDTSLAEYKRYYFDIFIESKIDGYFFGGFDLFFWYKDENSPIFIRNFENNGYLPNPRSSWTSEWLYFNKFNFFKINQLKNIKGKTYMNFETSFQFSDTKNSLTNFTTYWKGDILISKNF